MLHRIYSLKLLYKYIVCLDHNHSWLQLSWGPLLSHLPLNFISPFGTYFMLFFNLLSPNSTCPYWFIHWWNLSSPVWRDNTSRRSCEHVGHLGTHYVRLGLTSHWTCCGLIFQTQAPELRESNACLCKLPILCTLCENVNDYDSGQAHVTVKFTQTPEELFGSQVPGSESCPVHHLPKSCLLLRFFTKAFNSWTVVSPEEMLWVIQPDCNRDSTEFQSSTWTWIPVFPGWHWAFPSHLQPRWKPGELSPARHGSWATQLKNG